MIDNDFFQIPAAPVQRLQTVRTQHRYIQCKHPWNTSIRTQIHRGKHIYTFNLWLKVIYELIFLRSFIHHVNVASCSSSSQSGDSTWYVWFSPSTSEYLFKFEHFMKFSVDSYINSLIAWKLESLIAWLLDWLIDWLIDYRTCCSCCNQCGRRRWWDECMLHDKMLY